MSTSGVSRAGQALGKQRWPVERINAWLPESKRLPCYDRRGPVVEALLWAVRTLLVEGHLMQEF